MKTITQKTAALFLICLIALAITGYTRSHWTDIVTIFTTANMGHLEITIENEKLIPTRDYSKLKNKTITIYEDITTNWQIWVGITIKNNGTLPATITYQITTNNPLYESYFGNETHLYGPYTTTPPSEVWCDLNETNPPPPTGEQPTPINLSPDERLVVWQKIWLKTALPTDFTSITITSEYKATLSGWHDAVAVIYHLTKG